MPAQDICSKCERQGQKIKAKGMCYSCLYGSGKDKSKEEVLAMVADGTYGGRKFNLQPKKSVKKSQPAPRKAPPISPAKGNGIMREADSATSCSALAKLLPPQAPKEDPPPGVFLDLAPYPELHAWLKETVEEKDIPLAIIGLLEARRKNLLEQVHA